MDGYVKRRKKVGRPVIWLHPITGEYKIPPSDDVDMPLRYKMQGYERKEFTSYYEHAKWCKDKGLVNHMAEDVRNDGDVQRNRWGY